MTLSQLDAAAMRTADVSDAAAGVVAVGGLTQALAQVDRGAFWPDGRTPESDTDHSVGVALVAVYLAEQFRVPVDRGRLLALALVHDLVEVHAGDTWTLSITAAGRATKDAAEDAAADRLITEFGGVFPWLADAITEYRGQTTLAARVTYAADKIASKVPNLRSLQATLTLTGATAADCQATWDEQSRRLADLLPECPGLAAVNQHLARKSLATLTPS